MSKVKFGDIVKDVKIKINRSDNPYQFYVAGDHMDSEDLTIHRRGNFVTDDVGPAFVRLFKPGQVLYGSRRTYLKKISVADFDGICANTTFVFESKDEDAFEQRLLPFIMLSDAFTIWSISKSKGSTNPYVLFSDLAEFEFDLPTLAKQKVLANKLWAAYRLKEGYKKLLAATEEMVKSQFIEMFKDKIPNSQLRDWVDSNIVKVKKRFSNEDQIEYIDISSLDNLSNVVSCTTTYTLKDAPSRAQQCVEEGDILLSTVRPNLKNIAVNHINKENLVASTGFCILRPKKGYSQMIVATIMSDVFTQRMIFVAKGTNYPAFHDYDALNYPVYTPNTKELVKITTLFDQADKSKFELKKCIENIDKVIRSLINEQ